jgi:hypothetical protein
VNDTRVGDRVRLVSLTDMFIELGAGATGTVRFIDDHGTVHVEWDMGNRLGLIPGIDRWEVIGHDDTSTESPSNHGTGDTS